MTFTSDAARSVFSPRTLVAFSAAVVFTLTAQKAVTLLWGATVWGVLNHWCIVVFSRMGLPVMDSYFSWTWATVFLLRSAVPFVASYASCMGLIHSRNSAAGGIIRGAVRGAVSLVAAFPVSLLISRATLSLIPRHAIITDVGIEGGLHLLIVELYVVVLLGVPYLSVFYGMYSVMRRLWRGGSVPAK